jgi:hypothetical protein
MFKKIRTNSPSSVSIKLEQSPDLMVELDEKSEESLSGGIGLYGLIVAYSPVTSLNLYPGG